LAARTKDATVEDRLRTYRAKRDFRQTPEPAGSAGSAPTGRSRSAGSTGRFVVQRHRASSLHYDFRLEVEGVLASWAIPRGPTLDPGQRRLAVRVEDHPLGYYDFEGVIPGGQYGAGDVIVWDLGMYEADPATPDPARAIADGEFKFRLDGTKLRGAFVLLRTAGFGRHRRTPSGELRRKWLLIHRRDDAAVEGWDAEALPRSATSGRTNDEVAAGRQRGPRVSDGARRRAEPGPRPKPWSARAFCAGPRADRLDVASLVTCDGNRWSEPGEPTIYLAGDPGIAIAELGRHWLESAAPANVWSVAIDLARVVDLRDPAVRSALGIPGDPGDPGDPAWILDAKRCRSIAGRLRERGDCQGIVTPSAAFLDDGTRWNAAIFADRLRASVDAAIRVESRVVEIVPSGL
jgi:DNA ligase D-like protein (predicted 3'-phosphoesterase)